MVVQNGWVIAERYAQGIQPDMPLIGWSMSKSITHALIGRAIQEGLLDPGKPAKVPEWSDIRRIHAKGSAWISCCA